MEVVIIHGYSDKWGRMKEKLGDPLLAYNAALPPETKIDDLNIHYINYDSLEDAATYEDIAEGVYEKLKLNDKVRNLFEMPGEKLHVIVHSTGGLVIRQVMMQYEWMKLREKIRNIVFLAPANFGSPLAHVGASFIGRLVKGKKGLNEDWQEVGELLLKGLELASPKQWELALYDLFGEKGSIYGPTDDKVQAFFITGCKPYDGLLRSYVNEDGTDGTIVVAGAGLNSRKYLIDFARDKKVARWSGKNADSAMPVAIHNSLDHSSIVEASNPVLAQQIIRCLKVSTVAEHEAVRQEFSNFTAVQTATVDNYQQFIFRMTDDRNKPVTDYHLEFNVWLRDHVSKVTCRAEKPTEEMNEEEQRRSSLLDKMLFDNAHTHSVEKNYKRFLLNPTEIKALLEDDYVITISILAETGDKDIKYDTAPFENYIMYDPKMIIVPDDHAEIALFFDNTTTLFDVRVDRYSRLVERYSPPLYKSL